MEEQIHLKHVSPKKEPFTKGMKTSRYNNPPTVVFQFKVRTFNMTVALTPITMTSHWTQYYIFFSTPPPFLIHHLNFLSLSLSLSLIFIVTIQSLLTGIRRKTPLKWASTSSQTQQSQNHTTTHTKSSCSATTSCWEQPRAAYS